MIKIMPLMSSHRELIPEPRHAAQALSSNDKESYNSKNTYQSD